MVSSSHSKHKIKPSQKHSKKKSKSITKDKTKRRKRRNHSVSSSDEDSMTNSSVSCRSSDGDYKSKSKSKSKRRARSRDRKDKKGHKKRSKRARSVSESSGDDDSPRVKKRKRSKSSKDFVSRKKSHGKKHRRRRRSPSVSSLSGRSKSRSSCEFSDDSEREFVRKEGKESKHRDKDKETSLSKRKSRPRSRSHSPRSLNSVGDSYGSEDKVVEENNPKRLKSVIVVAHDREEEIRELNSDGNKAEIVFEHDDYPSKSNDSNDGVSRREASSFSHDVNSRELSTVDESNIETGPPDVQTSEIPESQRVVGEKTETVGSNCEDLAAVLRQKALENFLKRQGKLLTKDSLDKKEDGTSELNRSSSLMTNQAQHTSDVHSALKSGPKLDVPSSTKGKDTSLPRPVLGITRAAEKYPAPSGFADSRTKLGLSTPRKEFIGAKNTWRRQVVSQDSSLGKDSKQKVVSGDSSLPNPTTPKNLGKDSQRQIKSVEVSQRNPSVREDSIDNGSRRGILESIVSPEKVEGDVASQPSSMIENSSNEKTNEVGGDSQFQQKTMSVMRGGELVQVSYKVYIPNKAPALARRQLKR